MPILGLTLTTDLLIAIVGAVVAIGGLALARQERLDTRFRRLEDTFRSGSRDDAEESPSPDAGRNGSPSLFRYVPGLPVGIGIVLIVLSLVIQSYKIGQADRMRVVTQSFVIRTENRNWSGWEDSNKLTAISTARTINIDDKITCGEGYEPLEAWHEIKLRSSSETDSIDAISLINARVRDGKIQLIVRSRAQDDDNGTKPKGYAYVDVVVLCRSLPYKGYFLGSSPEGEYYEADRLIIP